MVADFERVSSPDFPVLLDLADHLVIGLGFASRLSGRSDPREAAGPLARGAVGRGRDLRGRGVLGGRRPDDGSSAINPAVSVAAVDTTGCGDVFHGAYARRGPGADLDDRLTFASAGPRSRRCARGAGRHPRPGHRLDLPERSRKMSGTRPTLTERDRVPRSRNVEVW